MAKARIAVIGAGLMGHGIAQVFALAGHEVAIFDSVMASLDTVKARILANLKDLGEYQGAVERVTPVANLPTAVREGADDTWPFGLWNNHPLKILVNGAKVAGPPIDRSLTTCPHTYGVWVICPQHMGCRGAFVSCELWDRA
mgnify:CR=1 FL=1